MLKHIVSKPFKLYVNYICLKNNRHRYTCPLGLWSVEGPDKIHALREALVYWQQFKNEGHYENLNKKYLFK